VLAQTKTSALFGCRSNQNCQNLTGQCCPLGGLWSLQAGAGNPLVRFKVV